MGQSFSMESFFLAETTKYLYLLFDPQNFIHNDGSRAEAVEVPGRGSCMVGSTLNASTFFIKGGARPSRSFAVVQAKKLFSQRTIWLIARPSAARFSRGKEPHRWPLTWEVNMDLKKDVI